MMEYKEDETFDWIYGYTDLNQLIRIFCQGIHLHVASENSLWFSEEIEQNYAIEDVMFIQELPMEDRSKYMEARKNMNRNACHIAIYINTAKDDYITEIDISVWDDIVNIAPKRIRFKFNSHNQIINPRKTLEDYHRALEAPTVKYIQHNILNDGAFRIYRRILQLCKHLEKSLEEK